MARWITNVVNPDGTLFVTIVDDDGAITLDGPAADDEVLLRRAGEVDASTPGERAVQVIGSSTYLAIMPTVSA